MSDRPPPAPLGRVGVAPLAISIFLRRLATLALLSPVILALVEVIAHPWSAEAWLPVWRSVLVAGPGMALALGVLGVIASQIRRITPGSLRVEGADLVLDRAGRVQLIPLASVRSGVVVPGLFGKGARVELTLSSGNQVVAEVGDVAEGARILAAVGVDATKRSTVVPLHAPATSAVRRAGAIMVTVMTSFMVLGGLLNALGPIPKMYIPVWLFTTTAAAWLAARAARGRSITVGADGLLIPRFFRDRFVPFAAIAKVEAEPAAVVVTLRDGSRPLRFGANGEAARAIALRVTEAMAAATDAPSAQTRLDPLARGGRTITAWREAASRLIGDAGNYRAAGLSEEDLTALLGSPEAPAEQRIGAALALAGHGDAPRARVRIAAEACASPKMRVALEAIAGGEVDEDALEEAIAEEAPRHEAEREVG